MAMKKATPWIVLLVIVGGVAAWYFAVQEPPQKHPSVVALPPEVTVVPEPEAVYPIEEIQPPQEPVVEPLPSFEDSDSAMIEALAELVGPESLDTHFVLEQVISRIVASIDSLDSRQVAPLVMPIQPAPGKFMVADGETLTIHPENAHRYAPYVRITTVVETQKLVDLYVRFYPLFEEAYDSLGHVDVYFNDRLVEVIDHLLATPEIAQDPALVKPEAVYLFADEDLENLSAGQKLLLRIGSANAVVITDKLREIRDAITQQKL